MLKLLVLLNVYIDGRSVWLSNPLQKPDFQKTDSLYHNEYGALNEYSEFHKTLVSSARLLTKIDLYITIMK